jgi:hypothetical protein
MKTYVNQNHDGIRNRQELKTSRRLAGDSQNPCKTEVSTNPQHNMLYDTCHIQRRPHYITDVINNIKKTVLQGRIASWLLSCLWQNFKNLCSNPQKMA